MVKYGLARQHKVARKEYPEPFSAKLMLRENNEAYGIIQKPPRGDTGNWIKQLQLSLTKLILNDE